MTAGILTLQISRGLPLALELHLCSDDFGQTTVDLTGCTAAAAIRPAGGHDPATPLQCTISDDASTGKILLTLEASATALLTPAPYTWDLIVTDAAGVPVPVLTGRVDISDNNATR